MSNFHKARRATELQSLGAKHRANYPPSSPRLAEVATATLNRAAMRAEHGLHTVASD